MLHGDLSNTAGYTIGFRCIDFLVTYRDESITDKILNAVRGKLKRAEINETVRSLMEYLYRDTEYTVDLIVENKDYTDELKEFLEMNVPFNRVVLIDKPSQISGRLLVGDLTYYVDNDPERLSLINSRFAVTLAQLSNLLKLRREVR